MIPTCLHSLAERPNINLIFNDFAGPSIKLHDFPCFPWPALTLQNKISTLGCTPCDALVRPKDLIYTNSMIYKVAHKQCDKFMYSLEKGKNY